MKKLLVITIAAAGLLAMQARAAVKIEMLAGFLYDHYGNPVPSDTNSTGLILQDTGGLGVPTLTLTAGTPDTVGTIIGGNWLVIGRADFSDSGVDGFLQIETDVLMLGRALGSGTVISGKDIDLLWISGDPAASGVISGSYYGSITETTDLSGGDTWVVPPDGSIYNPLLYTAATTAGDIPDSKTVANYVIGPEPSSISLVVVGLFGAIGLIRRRR